MPEPITAPYKPERFDGVVEEYVKYRLRYDPKLIAWVARDTGLSKKHSVVDLGCGPGFIANEIAAYAGQVIGVDPSPAMLEAARAEAPRNATYVEGSSVDLSCVPQGTHLVTMGQSFHWMDRDATLRELEPRLAPGGAVVLVGETVIRSPDTAWWFKAREIARRYSVMDDCAKLRHSDAWEPNEVILARSAFSDLRQIAVVRHKTWSFEDLLGNTLSRSASTKALLGDRLPDLTEALRTALAEFGPEPWITQNGHWALIAARPGAH